MKFIIVTKSYDENIGGSIVLHKLCHLINEHGGDAFIHPFITTHECSFYGIYKKQKSKLAVCLKKFETNPLFNTPIIKSLKGLDEHEYCVIYPEIVDGNPLHAKNVIRWFLHHPGFHTGRVQYNTGELYFSYGVFGNDFIIQGSNRSKLKLEVTHLFTEYYNLNNVNGIRHGTSYCIRKGTGRNIVHDLTDSILIDGRSHSEIANIFKKTKYFISYDLYTAYFWFAILCGCIPIVIPESNMTKEEWYPDEQSRIGIAYGFEDIPTAMHQAEQARITIGSKESLLSPLIKRFMNEVEAYFIN